MRLDWVVPCRYAEVAGDGTMSVLGAGLDTFWIPEGQLPASLGVFIAARVAGGEDEWMTEHTLSVRLLRPGPRRGRAATDPAEDGGVTTAQAAGS